MKFYKYYVNTFVMAGGDILFTIVVGGIAGYVLSKVKPVGHKVIFTILFTLTLMPGTCRTVPLYMTFTDFPYLHINMLESYWPMWLMAASDIFNIILFKNFFDGIPTSLVEAAKIDGATPFQTFTRITVPLLKPTILMTAIMSTNGTLQLFDESVNLTAGGPGTSTMTMSHYIFNQAFMGVPNFGYTSAMAFVILIMVAILALVQLKVGEKDE